MKTRIQRILSVSLSILVSVMLVAGVALAATTISTNIATDGSLTVGTTSTLTGNVTAAGALYANGGLDRSTALALAIGATNASAVDISKTLITTTIKGLLNVDEAVTFDTTLGVTGALTANGAVTLGDAAADVLTVNAGLVYGAKTITTGIDFDAATLTTDIKFSDSSTIATGVTSGTTLKSIVITPKSSVLTTGINYHTSLDFSGTFGVPAYRTYGLATGFTRDAVLATAGFDGVDTVIDARAQNNVVNNAAYKIQGAYIKAKNKGSTGGVVGLLRGLNVEVASEEGATTTDIVGQEIAVQNDSSTATANAIGLKFRRAGSGNAGLFNDIMLQNGETIDNATDGKIAFAGGYTDVTRSLTSQTTENNNAVLSLTTDSTFLSGTNITYSGGYGSSALKITGTYSGVGGGYSNIFSNITTSGAQAADGEGVIGIKSVVTNTAALTDGNVYGGQFIAKHNHTTNVMTASATLIGLEGWGYDAGAAPARTVIGGNFGYHNEGTVAKGSGSVYRGIQIFTDDASGASTADERSSLVLWNMAGTQTDGIKFVKSSGGWTTDITLQNGETISNATDGVVALSGNLKIASPATLTVTGTDPGTQVKLQYATTAMTGGQLQGIQVAATANLAADTGATGGITGIESKARQTTGSTFAVNQLRGILGTADARNAPVTTIYGIEANISSATGATVTTATGLQVSQQLASDGAGSSKIYGISIKADNVASTADIQLSGGTAAVGGNRPTIQSGAGAPAAGACVSTNLGSVYLRSDPVSVATAVYVCTAAATWTALTVN